MSVISMLLSPIVGVCSATYVVVYSISLPFKFLYPPVGNCFDAITDGIMWIVCKILDA